MKKNEIKRFILLSLAIGTILSVMGLLISMKYSQSTPVEKVLPQVLVCMAICLVSILPFAGIAIMLFCFFDNSSVQTSVHLLAKTISSYQITKNANIISPLLRLFLYETLRYNNSMLNLPLGQDISTISFNGYYVKHDCVFYKFQLVAPEKPIFDDFKLKEIIQNYINNQLTSYGIHGLSASYQSITTVCHSVYVNRVFFDDDNHTLSFDILYVCNEKSAEYYKRALKRDAKSIKPERVVYDDEI